MNPAEQTVTWLIALGVLDSPKKRVSDPESFLQTSLRDGVVLCRLLERLRPGSLLTVNKQTKLFLTLAHPARDSEPNKKPCWFLLD